MYWWRPSPWDPTKVSRSSKPMLLLEHMLLLRPCSSSSTSLYNSRLMTTAEFQLISSFFLCWLIPGTCVWEIIYVLAKALQLIISLSYCFVPHVCLEDWGQIECSETDLVSRGGKLATSSDRVGILYRSFSRNGTPFWRLCPMCMRMNLRFSTADVQSVCDCGIWCHQDRPLPRGLHSYTVGPYCTSPPWSWSTMLNLITHIKRWDSWICLSYSKFILRVG